MKRTYQIDERKAIDKFRSHLINDPGAIQMVLPLADIAELLREGVSELLYEAEKRLLMQILEDEVAWLSGERYSRPAGRGGRRWGYADGSVIIHGQKVRICRPRVRRGDRDLKLGSYELFRREEQMQRPIFERITRGLTMRGYGPAVRECGAAFGIQKSAVSENFVQASTRKVHDLLHRDLSSVRLCAVMLDGVEYKGEHMLTALGVDRTGRKTILGLHQGASENQKACEALLANLAHRGLDFQQPMLVVIDGSKALRGAVRKYWGDRGLVGRCQLHKRRNVCGHFSDEQALHWDRRLAQAYNEADYATAKKSLERVLRELMDVNPSAARSLEEGLEETLAVLRLNVPQELRKSLSSTNLIESAFSVVRVVCRNVKRWRPGDQRERWVGSGLWVAERKFRRVDGYRALPLFLSILDARAGQAKAGASAA